MARPAVRPAWDQCSETAAASTATVEALRYIVELAVNPATALALEPLSQASNPPFLASSPIPPSSLLPPASNPPKLHTLPPSPRSLGMVNAGELTATPALDRRSETAAANMDGAAETTTTAKTDASPSSASAPTALDLCQSRLLRPPSKNATSQTAPQTTPSRPL